MCSSDLAIESFECLKNRGPKDLTELTLDLTAYMVLAGNLEHDVEEAKKRVVRKLESGEAFEKMKKMIEAQGGNPKAADDYSLLPTARHMVDFVYEKGKEAGHVWEVDAFKLGVASMALGAGRKSIHESVDHGVGISEVAKIGDWVSPGDVLCKLHYNDERKKEEALSLLREAFVVQAEKPASRPLVYDRIDSVVS